MNFAANLSMMFTENDFPDRFGAAAGCGFEAVEYLFPYDWPVELVDARLREFGLLQALFNLPPGNWDAGERGLACLPGREDEFGKSIETATAYADVLRPLRVHCMAGLKAPDTDFRTHRETYVTNVRKAAKAFRELGIDVLIEPINPYDIPGYFLDDFGLALEILAEINRDSAANVRLQFDIYHCQRIHGDVTGWLERCKEYTAHLQIAGTPDRHEPDLGDLPLEEIIEVAGALHPDLWIGCEYRPAGKTEDGLGWLNRWR
ncbi:MAG: TIM barrel protein [Anderseniella sp.]|nr:TIM barrel protein [Anderseniella sp.]